MTRLTLNREVQLIHCLFPILELEKDEKQVEPRLT